MKKVIPFLALVVFMSSCYSTKIIAPANSNVRLATEFEPLPAKIQTKNWYILFGLVPLNKNKTDKVIAEANFKKVRVETKISFVDYLISIVTGFVTITPSTVIVEGDIKD